MAVIVVGDAAVTEVEPIVKKNFGEMPVRDKGVAPPMGEMSERGFATHYHHEEEAGETSVSIEVLKPRVNPPDNSERRLYDLHLMIAGQMINRRLERPAKQPDSPVSPASMRAGDFFDLGFALYASVVADCKPENLKAAPPLTEPALSLSPHPR